MNKVQLSEVQRLEYLEAMQVSSYVPRLVLPGALPSEDCDWPKESILAANPSIHADSDSNLEASSSSTPNATLAASSVDSKNTLARLQQDLGGTPAGGNRDGTDIEASLNKLKSMVVNTSTQEIASVQSEQKNSSAVQFHLALFYFNQDLLVLVPAQHMEQQHMSLLKNILFSVDVKTDALVPLDNFRWPPVHQHNNAQGGNAPIENNLAAAQENVHALLEGYQLKQSIKQILIFSTEQGEQLFPAEQFSDKQLHGMPFLILPDLQQMLDAREYKKQAWEKIKSLRHKIP